MVTAYDRLGTALLRPFAKLWFLWRRAVQHDLFVRQRYLPGQRFWLLPFGVIFRATAVLARCWRAASTSAALEVYSDALARHYGPEGLGYLNLQGDSDESRTRFAQQQGRIRFYIADRNVLSLEDGDSFLDCGCGAGQNIVELRRAFPRSPIKAFDFNPEAVAMVKSGSANDLLVSVEQGSVLDPAYLASYPTASIDHVLMSHVMGFVLRPTIEETKAVRQRIVDEMIRIARRTVIVLDAVELKRSEISVTIEQHDRGFVHDDLVAYFDRSTANGQVYVMVSPEDEAIIYRKKTTAGAPSNASNRN